MTTEATSAEEENLRTGRWTTQEMEYLVALVKEFEAGSLPLKEGATLRRYLADQLHCGVKRISKKMENTDYNGRQFFKPNRHYSDEELKTRRDGLEILRTRFEQSIEPLRAADGTTRSIGGAPPAAVEETKPAGSTCASTIPIGDLALIQNSIARDSVLARALEFPAAPASAARSVDLSSLLVSATTSAPMQQASIDPLGHLRPLLLGDLVSSAPLTSYQTQLQRLLQGRGTQPSVLSQYLGSGLSSSSNTSQELWRQATVTIEQERKKQDLVDSLLQLNSTQRTLGLAPGWSAQGAASRLGNQTGGYGLAAASSLGTNAETEAILKRALERAATRMQGTMEPPTAKRTRLS